MNRIRLSFGTRGLVLILTVSSFLFAWLGSWFRQSQREAEIIRLTNATEVEYDYQKLHLMEARGSIVPAKPPGPKSLRRLLGDNLFAHVVDVKLQHDKGQQYWPRLAEMSSLKSISFESCDSLKNCQVISDLKSIAGLSIGNCDSFVEFKGMELDSLKCIVVGGCKSIQNVDGLKQAKSLSRLTMDACPSLSNLDGLEGLGRLNQLVLLGCESLQNLEVFRRQSSLTHIVVMNCPSMEVDCDVFRNHLNLEILDLMNCKTVYNVSALTNLKNLKRIYLYPCSNSSSDEIELLKHALPNTKIEAKVEVLDHRWPPPRFEVWRKQTP